MTLIPTVYFALLVGPGILLILDNCGDFLGSGTETLTGHLSTGRPLHFSPLTATLKHVGPVDFLVK